MAGGRDSAVVGMVLIFCLLLSTETMVDAATFTVGDAAGWTFSVVGWPAGKNFTAGDILVFNYNPSNHNVVIVDEGGYDGCTVPSGSREFNSGNDRITLVQGQNFFLCSVSGHCQRGVKIAVTAA